MIDLIPAIDIIDGKCVRLVKGDYAQQKVYHEDPLVVAKEVEALGVSRLHVVDLDGAKSQHVVNLGVLRRIAESTDLTIDFGGGIKSDDDLDRVFDSGASMVTIGSIAVTRPQTMCRWIERYGADRIILGADVRDGKIAVNGWKEDSDVDLCSFLDFYIEKGIKKILCTDISKDGTLRGPAHELYKQILSNYPSLYLIASGGVASDEDIIKLNDESVPAVVFGKAYYEGKVNIKYLIDYVQRVG